MLTFLAYYSSCALLLVLVKEFKHQETGIRSALVFQDYWLLWLLSTVVFALLHVGPTAADAAALGLVLVVFWLLCLDALLFRNFGVELEPTNVRRYFGEILDGLAEEVKLLGASLGRTVFSWLPPAAACALLAPLWPGWAWLLTAPLLVYFGVRAKRLVGPKRAPMALAAVLVASLAAQRLADGPDSGSDDLGAPGLLAGSVALAGWLLAKTRWARRRPFFSSPAYLRNFLPVRSFADDPEFEPRQRHRHWFEPPSAPRRSDRHGMLRGANVLLVTLEGVARDHLALSAGGEGGGGARTPFLEQLAARSVVSRHHFCISPQTTNAHRAIYTASYPGPDSESFACLDVLRRRGYRTLYVTPEEASWFGLEDLVRRAGFDPLHDHDAFLPHELEPGRISDYVLIEQGVDRIADFAEEGGPFLVHVQTMNTHKPYRVVDHGRFGRWPDDDEVSRYRNCLEEMDWLLGRVFDGLQQRSIADDMLCIVTSDHGQAFGELGYHGHSNAVIRQETDVPFLLCHPALEPGYVDWSSHLDVLPTVLDLLGLDCPPGLAGESIFAGGRRPSLLLYSEVVRAGAPCNFGLVDGDRKYMVDQIYGQLYEMGWDDAVVRTLAGEDRAYFEALFHRLLAARGLLTG